MKKRSDLSAFEQKKVFGQALFWSREALATRPAHRVAAEAAIDEIYALAGYRAPAKKRWMSSPLSAVVDAGDPVFHGKFDGGFPEGAQFAIGAVGLLQDEGEF